jgi:hypothetical protein
MADAMMRLCILNAECCAVADRCDSALGTTLCARIREALDFELPCMANGSSWRRRIGTSLPAPQDIVPWQESPLVGELTYRAAPRSVVVLWVQTDDGLSTSSAHVNEESHVIQREAIFPLFIC